LERLTRLFIQKIVAIPWEVCLTPKARFHFQAEQCPKENTQHKIQR